MLDDEREWEDDDEDDGGDNWLASYSDMMTDLMAVFVILFSFAMMSQSYQNAELQEELDKNSAGGPSNQSGQEGESKSEDEFDKIYEHLKKKIDESGYTESILIEKTDEYINFRFTDSVLFVPNSAVVRTESYDILKYMGEILYEVDDYIDSIDITGHVADVGEKSDFDWELSADRALAVLKFFSQESKLPEEKMTIIGRGWSDQIAGNDTEEQSKLNRRVELKIIRKP